MDDQAKEALGTSEMPTSRDPRGKPIEEIPLGVNPDEIAKVGKPPYESENK